MIIHIHDKWTNHPKFNLGLFKNYSTHADTLLKDFFVLCVWLVKSLSPAQTNRSYKFFIVSKI